MTFFGSLVNGVWRRVVLRWADSGAAEEGVMAGGIGVYSFWCVPEPTFRVARHQPRA